MMLDITEYGMGKLKRLMQVVKTTKNWIDILFTYFGLKRRTVAKLRSGKKILVDKDSWSKYWDVLKCELLRLRVFDESCLPSLRRFKAFLVLFEFKGRRYLLLFPKSCGLEHIKYILSEVFVSEVYSKLRVKRKIVIDIGAYVGDTSIYFYACGARRVYSVEPYPYTYRLLKYNVMLNQLEDVIIPLNIGLSDVNTIVRLPDNEKDTSRSALASQPFGVPIRVLSLETLVKHLGITNDTDDIVLKLDCEGCEYSVIPKCKAEILRIFSEIILEYHDNPVPIINKLRSVGFIVTIIKGHNILHATRY